MYDDSILQQQKDQNHFGLLHNELSKFNKLNCTILIQMLFGIEQTS